MGKIYLRFFILCKVFKNTRLGPLNPFYKRFKREQFQIDLLELRNISKDNKGTNLLLTIIDSYTKFAWAVPLRNKEKSTVLEAFKSVISKLDEKPLNIISDLGTISPFFLICPMQKWFCKGEKIIPAFSFSSCTLRDHSLASPAEWSLRVRRGESGYDFLEY